MKKIVFVFFLFFFVASFAQEKQLASEYFRKGEYEKALSIYKKLHEANNYHTNYVKYMVKCYRQLEQFNEANSLIDNQIKKHPTQYFLIVEKGFNLQLQDQLVEAEKIYNLALASIETQKNIGYNIGRAFQDNGMLDYALTAYKKAMEVNPRANYEIHIASIYAEQNEIELMFESYLNMVDKDPKYATTVLRYIGRYITDDNQNEYNSTLKKAILRRAQISPKNEWNEMLSWLFMQQKEYNKAFIQEKALYLRNQESLERVFNLGGIAYDNKDYNTTSEVFDFVLLNTQNQEEILDAKLYLLYVFSETSEDNNAIASNFETILEEYGRGATTINIQIAYADFLTFKNENPQKAIQILKEALGNPISKFDKAAVKIKLGDVLVYTNQFNQALIYFSQVEVDLKNHNLAQTARFKVAQASYFKGDFKWAQTQLGILKKSTTQHISNDALDLHLLISDNTAKDTITIPLELFAKADLLAYQNKDSEAINILESIVTKYKGHAIEDETLYKQASLYEKEKAYYKAIENYDKIIQLNKEDILVDDAIYYAGKLYEEHITDPIKAQEYYKNIIYDYPSSIHLVQARKRYRKLRGDTIEQ